ncbi:hypothetical protein [Loigolactobacillus iwatensis]|uniref:hypothetical protein n=1 Tax=Loigolactobacillus iwatensis TaxID=1267156 RepID=UPI000F7F600D|nr:hypothetical protein [Loigolactobacillus iwatensis]
MNIIVIVVFIVLILLLGGGLFVLRRLRRNRALRILQANGQQTTDEVVTVSLAQLQSKEQVALQFDPQTQRASSELAADIWGRGVLLFEYHFEVAQLKKDQLASISDQFEADLNEIAQAEGLKAIDTRYPVFVVSDMWLFKGQLHFDIAYLINQGTVNYIKDMRKLSVEKGTN